MKINFFLYKTIFLNILFHSSYLSFFTNNTLNCFTGITIKYKVISIHPFDLYFCVSGK